MRRDEARVRTVREEIFPAPTRGWVQAGNLVSAPPDAAEVLDNFFVTAQGARLRGGKVEFADLNAPAVRLLTYTSGGSADFFGSTASKLFDLDRLNTGGSNAFGDIEGLSSGDWSAVQMTTSAGQFLVAVNGADNGLKFDGANWNVLADTDQYQVSYENLVTPFQPGETLTNGASTAVILAVLPTSATTGTLILGPISDVTSFSAEFTGEFF